MGDSRWLNAPYDCLGVCVGQYPISTLKQHFSNQDSAVYMTMVATARSEVIGENRYEALDATFCRLT